MTVETKTTIQLSDMKAIEFECRTCHRVVSYRLETARNPPVRCECAGAAQWMTIGDMHYREVTQLIDLLQRYGKTNGEQFTMRLVIGENK